MGVSSLDNRRQLNDSYWSDIQQLRYKNFPLLHLHSCTCPYNPLYLTLKCLDLSAVAVPCTAVALSLVDGFDFLLHSERIKHRHATESNESFYSYVGQLSGGCEDVEVILLLGFSASKVEEQ